MKVTAIHPEDRRQEQHHRPGSRSISVRDIGGVDIKAASELSINPNHWSRNGRATSRVAWCRRKEDELRQGRAADHPSHHERVPPGSGRQLAQKPDRGIPPSRHQRQGRQQGRRVPTSYQIRKYVEETPLADESRKHHLDNLNKVLRYERFRHEVLHQRGFHLCIDTVTADDIRDFKLWMQEEHKYVDMYPVFYRNEVRRNVEQKRSENSMSSSLYRIRTVIKWCVKRGLTRNNPFDQYQIARPMYGDPFYLTLEERDKVYYADLSGMGATYPVYRDVFMFQCLIGCRVSDLNRLTKANIVDGFVEYIPQKTKMEHAGTVRVPLNQKALDILERYKDLENALLPRFSHFGYNKKIKEILKYVGIDRKVIVLDPKTREDVARPLYEVASTHTARKTFIGNLYRQVKDPNLIASMSGHSEGSRAFARYRKIDDEMKKELVNLLD